MNPIEYILAVLAVVLLGLTILGIFTLDLRVIALGLFGAFIQFVAWRLFVVNKNKK